MATTTPPRPAPPTTSPRPAVPLALWPTAQNATPDGTATDSTDLDLNHDGLTPELARRIVEEFSHPGDLILDLTCTTGAVLTTAAERQRRAVGVTGVDRGAVAAFDECEQQLPPEQARDVEVITADIRGLAELRPDLTGAADLAVLTNSSQPPATTDSDVVEYPPGQSRDDADGALPATLDAARALLRPGGLLVTVTSGARHGRAFFDTAGQMVRLTRAAGFGYTQHVIALRAPIDGDHLTATPSRADLARLRADRRAGGRRHLLVHQDVCVFVAPAPPETAPHDLEDVTA